MKNLLFCCVVLTVLAGSYCLQWQDCGSKEGKVTKVLVAGCEKVDTCPLKHNTSVSFEVDFSLSQKADNMKAVVHGIIDGLPVPFPLDNSDGCKDSGLKCPLAPGGSYTYKQAIFVKPIYPKVRVVVKWELKNSDGNDIFCIELPATIVD